MDDEPFLCSKQFVRDHERPNGIFARPTASIAHDMRVALGKPGELRRIEPSVYAGEDEKPARRWQRELSLVAEGRGIGGVRLDNFVLDSAHLSNPILSLTGALRALELCQGCALERAGSRTKRSLEPPSHHFLLSPSSG
jgi:hypothetical protein